MKKLVYLVVLAVAAYFIWTHFGSSPAAPVSNPNTTPAANATQRIDNLSGAAY